MPQFEPILIRYTLTPASWRWFVYLRWRSIAIFMLVLYHVTPFAGHRWIAALFTCCVCGGAIWEYSKQMLTPNIYVGREVEKVSVGATVPLNPKGSSI